MEEEIATLKPQIARIALQEYQDRGMNSTAVLFTSTDIDEVIDYMTMSQQVASTSDTLLQDLQLAQAGLADLQASETATLDSIQADKDALTQNINDTANKVAKTQSLIGQLVAYQQQVAAAAATAQNPDNPDNPDASFSTTVENPSLGFINPLPGGLMTRPFAQGGHTGTDLAKPCGTQILSPANGVVTAYYWDGQLGNRLTVNNGTINGQEVMTSYAHLSGTLVGPGQTVAQGQPIALVGSTGYSTGCHLHFMLMLDGQLVNPAPYIGV